LPSRRDGPGREQDPTEGGDLLVGQRGPVHLGRRQCGQEISFRPGAALGHEIEEVGRQLGVSTLGRLERGAPASVAVTVIGHEGSVQGPLLEEAMGRRGHTEQPGDGDGGERVAILGDHIDRARTHGVEQAVGHGG
jgi:hypothetical protein